MAIPPDVTVHHRALKLTSYLGSGASASVYSYETEAIPKETYAVKAARDGEGQPAMKSLQHERSILEELRECPHVPRVAGFGPAYLVLQPVGELLTYDLMQELSSSLFKWLPVQLVETLEFAHQRGIVHRDVRPANIIVHLKSMQCPSAILIDW